MKNLKIYLALTIVTILTGTFILGCSKDDNFNDFDIKKTPVTQISTGPLSCFIDGETVTNPEHDNALSTVKAGTSTTYRYVSNPKMKNFKWEIVSGEGISFIGNTSNSSVTVSFSKNFTGGSIKVIATDLSNQNCNPILPIKN